jgi:TPR repeat protein
MAKLQRSSKQSRKSKTDDLFSLADKLEDSGDLRAAFRLFLAGAKAGDRNCQLNVGNYYDDGKGTRRNRAAGLYWYKRAYRRGDAAAANNIGILWRNEGKSKRALSWFRRAVKMGENEANLEIARYYLGNENSPRKAIPYLQRVCRSNRVTEAGAEEAERLLNQARKKIEALNREIIQQQR